MKCTQLERNRSIRLYSRWER